MPTVNTTYGTLEGLQKERHQEYLGIPFAAPPVGDLRFKAPQPPESWTGTRPAKEWGLAARQTSHPIPGFAASGPQDEDCLYLNVYTPVADGQKRPVLFWIHGGGFTHGSGGDMLYEGGALATRGDVIVVTINYRLGAFGYLYLGHKLPGRDLTANAGQLDQVAALQWVRDNIAYFGGDPGNVTIFGESAGAAAVGALLAMPAAKGLFHKAILQSGTGRAATVEAADRTVETVLEAMGFAADDTEKLLRVRANDILEAQPAVSARAQREGGMAFGPVADGPTLPGQPIEAIQAGFSSGIPVMLGTNRDEIKLFAASTRRDELDDAGLASQVASALPKASATQVDNLIATYRASREAMGLPTSNLDMLDAVNSDLRFRTGAMRLALAQVAHQPNTYLYLFTYASPARRGALGSCHALEMPFVFGTTSTAPTQDRFAGTGPDVDRLSAAMMDAWISFARTGKPGHEGIGEWPAYNADTRPTMIFDRESGVQNDPFQEERVALEALL